MHPPSRLGKLGRVRQTSSPGSSLVWRVKREEDPGEIGNNSQSDWSTFNIAFSRNMNFPNKMYFLIKNRLFLQVCVDSLVHIDEFIKVIYCF